MGVVELIAEGPARDHVRLVRQAQQLAQRLVAQEFEPVPAEARRQQQLGQPVQGEARVGSQGVNGQAVDFGGTGTVDRDASRLGLFRDLAPGAVGGALDQHLSGEQRKARRRLHAGAAPQPRVGGHDVGVRNAQGSQPKPARPQVETQRLTIGGHGPSRR